MNDIVQSIPVCDVYPVTVTQIDWQILSAYLGNFLHRRIGKHTPQTLEGYIQILDQMEAPTAEVSEAIKRNSSILQTISIGFLIQASRETIKELDEYKCTQFVASEEGETIIWTQSLMRWRAIMLQSTDRASLPVIVILNKIFMYFEQMGLKNAWWGWTKRPTRYGQGTFYLDRINV